MQIKIGVREVRHGRYIAFKLANVAPLSVASRGVLVAEAGAARRNGRFDASGHREAASDNPGPRGRSRCAQDTALRQQFSEILLVNAMYTCSHVKMSFSFGKIIAKFGLICR